MITAKQSIDSTEIISRQRQTAATTTSSSIAHGTGRTIPPIDLEAIRTAYIDVLGALNAFKARDIEYGLENGLDASAILDALDQTAMAARPTHYYLRAIIRRYVNEGIHTAEEAEQSREEFRALREQAKRETWGTWYRNPEDDYPW